MSEEAATEEHEAPAPATTADGRIRVQAQDGSYGSIPAAKVGAAVDHGYRVEGAQEYAARKYEQDEGVAGQAKAFAGNFASSATLGLSDVVGGAIGGEKFRTARALGNLSFPTTATGGQIGGMIIPALIPGGAEAEAANLATHGAQAAEAATALGRAAEGTSLLGRAAGAAGTAVRYSPAGLALKGGELASELVGHGLGAIGVTGESLLGRTASSALKMAAGGAIEGGAFGAGGALSEAALAPGGDYDTLAQKLWSGAIHGAEFGATVGGGLGAGSELLAAGARKLGGTFSARRALQDLSDAKTLKSAGLEGEDIARISQANPERIKEIADVLRKEESIGWADTIKDRAGKLSTAREEVGETLATMRKSLDENLTSPVEGVNVRNVVNRADERIAELKASAIGTADEHAVERLSKELEAIKRGTRDYTADSNVLAAEGKPGSWNATFEQAERLKTKLDEMIGDYSPRAEIDGFKRGLLEMRTDLEHEFQGATDRVMGKATPEFAEQYADALARQGVLKEVSGIANKRIGSIAGRGQSMGDTLAAAAGFVTMGPKGILAAAANRAMRSVQADHIIGKLASEVAKFDQHVETAAGRWASKSQRAARGGEAVLETAPLHHAAGGHSAVHEAIERAHEIGKVTTSSTLHVRSEAAEQHERIEEYFHKLHAAEHEAKAPEGTLVHIPDAPETQKAAEKIRRAAAAWVVSQAPVSPAQIEHPMLARMARQLKPDPVEVMSFLRKVKTVEDPMVAIKAFEDGRLTTDHVKALAASKPAVLTQLRNAVVARVTAKNADIAYDDRIQLSILLGVEADPTMRPVAIAMGQRTYAKMKEQAAAQEQKQPPGPSAPGQAPKGTASRVDVLEEGNTI